jgi:hypothetical protein
MHENGDGLCMQKYLCESHNSKVNLRANFQKIITKEIPLHTFVDVFAQNALLHIVVIVHVDGLRLCL